MENYKVLITDLTEYGSQRCVAGWDLDRKIMIRPEPSPAAFWEQDVCGDGKIFQLGNIVDFKAEIPNPKTKLPHLNEDRVVSGQLTLTKSLSDEDFKSALRASHPVNREQAFGAPVKIDNNKAYLEVGTNSPSLIGVSIKKNQIRFTSDSFGDNPPKPRCIISRRDGKSINLSIASAELRTKFRAGGVRELNNSFGDTDDLIIRLGCARGFGNYPNRCYMQVNGIFRV
jgi:hypothetical protein